MGEQLRFIALPEVIHKTGLSKSGIYSTPDFPRPIKIRGAASTDRGRSRWVESEVNAWMASRVKQRDEQLEIAKADKPSGFPYLRHKPSSANNRKSAS